MRTRWRTLAAKSQRLFRLVVLFCILRVVAGVAVLLLFDRDAVAWSAEVTIIVIAMLGIYLLVALAVRRWSPPRPSSR